MSANQLSHVARPGGGLLGPALSYCGHAVTRYTTPDLASCRRCRAICARRQPEPAPGSAGRPLLPARLPLFPLPVPLRLHQRTPVSAGATAEALSLCGMAVRHFAESPGAVTCLVCRRTATADARPPVIVPPLPPLPGRGRAASAPPPPRPPRAAPPAPAPRAPRPKPTVEAGAQLGSYWTRRRAHPAPGARLATGPLCVDGSRAHHTRVAWEGGQEIGRCLRCGHVTIYDREVLPHVPV